MKPVYGLNYIYYGPSLYNKTKENAKSKKKVGGSVLKQGNGQSMLPSVLKNDSEC